MWERAMNSQPPTWRRVTIIYCRKRSAGTNPYRGVEVHTEGGFDAALKAFTRGKGPYVINVHLGKLDVARFNSKMSEAMRH